MNRQPQPDSIISISTCDVIGTNHDWKIFLLTLEALPYLSTLPHDLTDDECDIALGLAFQRLQSQLPFDEACDLYCDLDMRFPDYIAALRARFAAREVPA